MTPDVRRRAWLETKIDDLSAEKMIENMNAFEQISTKQHMTKDEEHAFECGWDWAVEMVKKDFAALVDAPLGALEDALEAVVDHGDYCQGHRACAGPWPHAIVHTALARLPWREEGKHVLP